MILDKEMHIFNYILNSIRSIVYIYNIEKSEILFLNQITFTQLDFPNREAGAISFSEYLEKIYPDDRERYTLHIQSILGKKEKNNTIEYRLKSRNAGWKWYSDSIVISNFGDGTNQEVIGYATNINEIRKKEERYLRDEIQLKAILDNTIEYYFFLDSDYKIQSLNKNAKEFLYEKFNRHIFEGNSILDSLPLEAPSVFTEHFHYALTGTTIQYESQFNYQEGQTKWYQIRYLPIRNKKNKIVGVCFIIKNMTDIRKSNEDLKELNHTLEERVKERTKELNLEVIQRKNTEVKLTLALEKEKELNELKSKFIAMVSHQFRTPMTIISMSTQILAEYGNNYSNQERDKHYDRMKEAIGTLTNLVEGVTKINHSEASNLSFQPTNIDLKQFLDKLISNFESMHSEYKFELIVQDINRSIFCLDGNLIMHILENLLNNSVKYSTNNKNIRLEVLFRDMNIYLIVEDFGVGIPEEDKEKIFQIFYRGNNVGNISGSGLGLNVVKNFTELHGGSIAFTSTVGVGTKFHVMIPIIEEAIWKKF